jgi:drug/metabolite transporter (DMT)-like permease
MLVEINKWCAILSLAYCILTGNFMSFIDFSWSHPLFVVHLLSMAVLSFIGHIFIYKMIKEFRQHIVPFVITTRKIISVGISMMYFHHPSSPIQIVCIFVVLSTTLYEFLREILNSKK